MNIPYYKNNVDISSLKKRRNVDLIRYMLGPPTLIL